MTQDSEHDEPLCN